MTKVKYYNHILPLLLLIILTVFLALPTVYYGYLLEDYKYLRPYSFPEIVKTFHSQWEPLLKETEGYRPLHSVHYAFFYLIIGGDPVENHIFHILLFTGGIIMIYFLALRCGTGCSAAFWCALIYSCLATTAWQVSWLVNRQHLLEVIFFAGMILTYNHYLLKKVKIFWLSSFILFVLALLLKETAVTYPIILFFFAVIIRRKTLSSQIRPLIPFFLILILFITLRIIITNNLTDSDTFSPPIPSQPLEILHEYSRSLLGTFIQSQGIDNPTRDFPIYDYGLATIRDYTLFLSLIGFFLISGYLFIQDRTINKIRSLLFGVALLLSANIIVSVWYRTNRLFISSIGLAIIMGLLLSNIFRLFHTRKTLKTVICISSALVLFLIILSINIQVFLEIQWALRPEGFLARTWDRWSYDEYLERRDKNGYRTITGDQLKIFKEKLRRTGREDWIQNLS